MASIDVVSVHPPSVASPPPDQDGLMFRDLMERFAVLAETCSRFSQEVYRRTGAPPEADLTGAIEANLSVSRTVFDLSSIEILVVTYFKKVASLRELQRILGRSSEEPLYAQLGVLEALGLVQREVARDPPDENQYSLTHKGMMIARLGEPLLLYLRLAHGWSKSAWEVPVAHQVPSELARDAVDAR